MGDAADRFRQLAKDLREAGETGLRKELYKAVSDAARPLAAEIRDVERLRPYMPDRYAETLGPDLAVTTAKRTGKDPGVTLRVKGRAKGRKVKRLDAGVLAHPLFGDRERWYAQTKAVRPGFADDPVRAAVPRVSRGIEAAVSRVNARLYRFTR